MARASVTHNVIDEHTDWMHYAACKKVTTEVFFNFKEDIQKLMAARYCDGCPVREECGRYALTNVIDYGVWGGMTEGDRRRILRRGGRRMLRDTGIV